MNIASLDHSGIREARERLRRRQHQLEETAVANLSHRPVHFGLRLIKAAFVSHPDDRKPRQRRACTG